MTTPAELAREVEAVERILTRLGQPAPVTLAALAELEQAVADAEDVAARRLPASFRRRLFPHERAAGVLFADVDAAQDRTAEQLAAITGAARTEYADALGRLVAAVPAAELAAELDQLGNPNRASALAAAAGREARLDDRRAELVEVLLDHRTRAAARLSGELAAQTGRPASTPGPPPSPAEVDLIATRAAELILAAIAPITDLAAGYAARARAVTTLAEDDDDLVGRLRRDLDAAAAKAERGRLAAARAAAQQTEGTARVTVAPTLGRIANVYASELLDRNTCEPCSIVDGRDYGTLDAARVDYPLGTYVECDGGSRCRGTLVIVWSTEAPPTRGRPAPPPPPAGPRAPRTPRDDGPPAVLDPTIVGPVAPPAAAAPVDLTALTDDELVELTTGLADDEAALARVFAELDRRDELDAAPPPAAAPEAADAAADLRRQISAAYADDDYDLAADLGRQLDELEGPDESWAAWEGQANADEVLDAARADVREQADRFLADLGIDLPSPEERAAAEAARAVERAAKARRPPGRLRDRLTAEWQEHAELLYMNSENDDDVRGVLLRKDRLGELHAKYGRNVNLTYLLYTQPMHVSSYYASDELLAYWRADPTRRMTLAQYLRAGGVRDRKTLAAAAAADSAFAESYTKDRRDRPKRGRR